MADLHVRQAKPEDAAAVHQLYRFAAIPGSTGCLVFEPDHFRKFAEAPQARFYVAEAGDRIVGFVLAYDLVVWAYVDMIVVSEDWRRKGVAGAMLGVLEMDSGDKWRTIEMCHMADAHMLKDFADRSGYKTNGGDWTWRYKFLRGHG